MKQLDEYWQAVQRRVCLKCVDSDGHGNCRLTAAEECGLQVHFPRIVETVLSVKSDNLDSYIETLRSNVCTYCKNQSPDGKCMFRSKLDCGLDRYFPMVVETIEEVRLEQLRRSSTLDRTSEPFGDHR